MTRLFRSRPRSVRIVVPSGITRAEIPAACETLRVAIDDGSAIEILCETPDPTDAVTIEMVLRLHLTAVRLGAGFALRNPSPRFRELLGLCGLSGVLRVRYGPSVEPWREPEQWEQPSGIEKERDGGDPVA